MFRRMLMKNNTIKDLSRLKKKLLKEGLTGAKSDREACRFLKDFMEVKTGEDRL